MGEDTVLDESELEDDYIEADGDSLSTLEDSDELFESVDEEDDLMTFDNDLAEENMLNDEDILDEE